MTRFSWAIVAHLISDFFLQNEWQAQHKGSLSHSAALVHGSLSAAVQVPVLGWLALPLGVAHALIDTRRPLVWWRRLMRQTEVQPNSHAAVHAFAFFQDQAAHILMLAVVVWVHDRQKEKARR